MFSWIRDIWRTSIWHPIISDGCTQLLLGQRRRCIWWIIRKNKWSDSDFLWLLDEAILHAFFLYLSQNSFYGYTFFYTDELSGLIADKMKNHPYYTQQLSQQVWFRTPDSGCTQKNVEETFNSLIDQLSLLFANIIDTLTSKQINFLLAVADGVSNFSSKEVLTKYKLGTSANIKNCGKRLWKKIWLMYCPETWLKFKILQYWLKYVYK